MRYLLALLLAIPAFTQAPAEQAKPAAAAAPAPEAAAAPAPDAANPAPNAEQWLTGSIDFGYRFRTDVQGSSDTYRSIVNLNPGPRLFGFDFTIRDPKHRLFDQLNARVANWGDPYNTAHVDASKKGIYDFRFNYSNILYFNALPSFANPAAPAGFNEQSFDVHRKTSSFALDLFPGSSRIVPYLAYDRNSGSGTGIATWSQDVTNTYAVPQLQRDGTSNYRGGVRFELNRFHVTLEGGGTEFKDDDAVYANNLGTGDQTGPYLGQILTLNHLQESYGIRAHSKYTKALLTASPFSWLNLYGQFLYSEPKTNVNFIDIGTGNLLQISTLLFYYGQVDTVTGSANKPHVSGNAGFELRPFRRVRVMEFWSTDRFHDAAYSMITEQMLLTATLAGNTTPTVLPDWESVNYNRNQTDLFWDVTKQLTLRGGYRYEWGDAIANSPPLSQIGPLESGQLSRQTAIAGFNFRPVQKLSLNSEYERASTARAYFRTSLYNYNQLRSRVRWQAITSLSVQASFALLDNQNPTPGLQYDMRSRDGSLSVNWTPKEGKRIAVLAEYDRSTFWSNVNYLLPPFLSPAVSSYRDDAHLATTAVELTAPKSLDSAKLSVGGSLAINNGSSSSRYYEPLARLSVPMGKHVYWNTEWQWYGFNENLYLYEGFRTHVFQTGLKLAK
ncbi:MAG: hypothetical protein ABSC23_21350 [Bryobacteraceae bacterium]|jgi:hypothetical protein